MKWPESLQARLALNMGLGLAIVWLVTAWATATVLRGEINEVFDSALEETAQRILPLAVLDILSREKQGISQRIATLRQHKEFFTYVVRDDQGRVLLRSHGTENVAFPPFESMGFRQTSTHRLYYDAALQGTITITVAEPLSHRAEVARETLAGLALPLLIVIPLSFLGVLIIVRRSMGPLRQFSAVLATRGAADLTPAASDALPSEMMPVVQAVNQLLGRLRSALEAERSFTANAAHELRTPLAAALAQTQRLIAETNIPPTSQRALNIEAELKRLIRLSEKLLQLARAEGGRLRTGIPRDIRPILQMVVSDLDTTGRDITPKISSGAVLSDIDPDAFSILSRNLIENALKHGTDKTPVLVILTDSGLFRVINDGPVVPFESLKKLVARFERGQTNSSGSGLGLAIAKAIADGTQGTLHLQSPATGQEGGFEATYQLPTSHDV